jgi:alkylation response protein AidB-like acyl-CoA dehydrogenase
MDFALTPEQALLQRTAREALADIAPMAFVRAMMADARGFTDDAWQRIVALAWPGMVVAEEHGGAGLGMTELAIVLAEMGRVVMPGPFLATIVGGLVIAHAGDAAQRRQWLPRLADGSGRATFALLEASARWDLDGVTAVAQPVTGGWRLGGTKLFVPDAHLADAIVCAMRRADDGEPALVVVDRAAARLTPLDGVDATRKLFAVNVDGVQVDAGAMLRGDVTAALAAVLDAGRVALAAEMTGGAERVLETTVEHVKTRRQFGQPIGAFQAVQHACADMMVAVECAKAATTYAAWAIDQRADDAPFAAATAKATANDAYRAVTAKAIQLHGGIGFTWEHDLHIHYKRAMASEPTFGDSVWNRELAASRLGL